MSPWRRLSLASAFLIGSVGTLLVYAVLFAVQIDNADMACESYPQTVSSVDSEDVRGIGFENSFLNLGGLCTYRMDDGSVDVTREPGWWFTGTIAGFVAILAGLVVLVVRRKGHSGIFYGLTTLVAPPLGLTLAVAAQRRR